MSINIVLLYNLFFIFFSFLSHCMNFSYLKNSRIFKSTAMSITGNITLYTISNHIINQTVFMDMHVFIKFNSFLIIISA